MTTPVYLWLRNHSVYKILGNYACSLHDCKKLASTFTWHPYTSQSHHIISYRMTAPSHMDLYSTNCHSCISTDTRHMYTVSLWSWHFMREWTFRLTSCYLLTWEAGMLAHIASVPLMPMGTSCKVMLLVELTFHPSCKPFEYTSKRSIPPGWGT